MIRHNMKNLGEFIGHFTVKNDEEKSLFKVYFYNKGISFDDTFLRGIIENEDTHKDFMKINSEWKSNNKDKEATMKSVMEMTERHQNYLSNFFLEVDFVDKSNQKSLKDSNELFFQHLHSKNMLIDISRKEFESKIVSEEIGEFYVENLKNTKLKSKFYTYDSVDSGLSFYLMVVDNKIKIGFSDKDIKIS